MQIIVDDRVVGYDRVGKGPVVVLLHGWGVTRSSLGMIAEFLSKDYEVVSVDVPGFGQSGRPERAWALGDYSSWLSDFLTKIQVKEVYALIGHSNGGAIAIKSVACGMPVSRLVLLGASGVRNREKGKKLFLQSAAKAGKVATKLLPAGVQKSIRTKWYKKIGSELYDSKGMEETFKKVVAEDLLVDAAMITIPTLLVYGSDDRATPPLYGEAYAKVIDGAELHIVESAGHYSFVDRPDAVLELIDEFMRR